MSGNNTVFNTILIDKFRAYIDLNSGNYDMALKLKEDIISVLSKHYIHEETRKAFEVKIAHGKLMFWFTPTRYYENIYDIDKYTDTNLSMPTQVELLGVFDDLLEIEEFRNNLSEFKITQLDLTKNILVKYPVSRYIKHLKNREYKGRFKAIFHTSEDNETTLSVTTIKRDTSRDDKVGDREIIFYDKVKELKNKANLDIVMLKQPLSNIETMTIPENLYHPSNMALCIKCLNILRVEQQYSSSRKIKAVSKFLDLQDKTCFRVEEFISLLKENVLYQKLEDFYIYQLQDIVFFNNPNTETKEPDVYTSILSKYWEKFATLGLDNVFSDYDIDYRKLKLEVQEATISPIYNELYEKIIKQKTLWN